MTITRNPKGKDARASRFISAGGKDGARRKLVPVWVSIDPDLLDRINEMAAKSYMNRSAFIVQALRRDLERAE